LFSELQNIKFLVDSRIFVYSTPSSIIISDGVCFTVKGYGAIIPAFTKAFSRAPRKICVSGGKKFNIS